MSALSRLAHLLPLQSTIDGQQPVSAADIAAWLLAVPRMAPDSPRAAAYIRGYNVASKIRRAKDDGTFWLITEQ